MKRRYYSNACYLYKTQRTPVRIPRRQRRKQINKVMGSDEMCKWGYFYHLLAIRLYQASWAGTAVCQAAAEALCSRPVRSLNSSARLCVDPFVRLVCYQTCEHSVFF